MLEWLAACLRGEAPEWPRDLAPTDFLEEAALHGVHGLLEERRRTGDELARGMPNEARAILERWVRFEAVRELLVPTWIQGVLSALGSRGVPCVVLKGAALAYSLYRQPHLRPRADLDLLIPEARRDEARSALAELGYQFHAAVSGRFVSAEMSAAGRDTHGIDRIVDVHWRISNALAFGRALPFEELAARAQALPTLGPQAQGPDAVDALIIACLHRVAHRHSDYWLGKRRHRGDRLIWLYDVDLIARRLDEGGWTRLAHRAGEKGLRAVCLDGLRRATALFGTPVPAETAGALAAGAREAAAGYLHGGRVRWLATELRALPGWSERMRLMVEHAFPPAGYMLARHGRRSPWWLPGLYLRRGLRGAWRMLRER
jgi:Uncharacterised nucleotidyltransferase